MKQRALFSGILVLVGLGLMFLLGQITSLGGLSTLVLIWVYGLGIIVVGIIVAEKWGKANASILIIGLMSGFTILADYGSIKIGALAFGKLELVAPAGSLLFAVLMLGEDYLNEFYGEESARMAVWAGWFGKVAVALGTLFVVLGLPSPSTPDIAEKNAVFDSLLAQGPRLNIVSIIAYLIAGLLNVRIYARLKTLTKGKHLWLRNNVSSLTAVAIDNIVFTFGAFLFLLPVTTIWQMALVTIVIHWSINLMDTFAMYFLRHLKTQGFI